MVNCKSSLKTVALFGGTFDPLHNGHLQSAVELKQRLGLDQFKLLPCHLPPHDKVPGCSSEQRLAMAELAVEGTGLEVDSWELQRDELSYSVDTLAHFRQLLGAEVSLSWVMGSDAFALFSRWHRWQDFLSLGHIIVMARSGQPSLTAGLETELRQQFIETDSSKLKAQATGLLVEQTLTPWPISSTALRALLAEGQTVSEYLPAAVQHYINNHQLYKNADTAD